MPYHGSCGVCALALGLCIFGSMTTSAGVSLLLNYEMFGGNSTSPDTFTRTLPPRKWEKSVGIALSGGGLVMFLTGMLMAVLCLTVGISLNDKLGDKLTRSKRMLNDGAILCSVSFGEELARKDRNDTPVHNGRKQWSGENTNEDRIVSDNVLREVPPDDTIPNGLNGVTVTKSILKPL